jgi:hypothetical protein
MYVFFRCVAEAVVEKGLRGLAEMVPGGVFAFEVATAACKKYHARSKEPAIRTEIGQLAQASFDEARKSAADVVQDTVPPTATIEERLNLELYLSQVPGAVRASLKRPEDATGKTVPPAFTLNTPEDVLKLLPPRPPRFQPGNPVPGLAGWNLIEPLGASKRSELLAQSLPV